jgi:hypothetical protein
MMFSATSLARVLTIETKRLLNIASMPPMHADYPIGCVVPARMEFPIGAGTIRRCRSSPTTLPLRGFSRIAPTPAKARQLRKPTVEQILKRHRIRRVDADTVLRTLREPAIKVTDGVAEAASIHLRSLFTRLRVVNRELREAEVQLDKLCMTIGESEPTSGDCLRRQDVLILRSMPGIGRINLAASAISSLAQNTAVAADPCASKEPTAASPPANV